MKSTTIHLGYAVGDGAPVTIPLRHLAITGQTQESGKTTTLEALVARSGLPAIAFVTKRGEGSFAGGRRLAPYFRERADWQFVDQLLSAQLREKNKFLRPWIIKVCRNTRTLADVHREVRTALEKARGFNEGIYTQLDAYLDLIVPEIGRAELADSIDLGPGVNVMDLSAYSTPMQMLFVQSAIDWVNEHEHGVVTIIPEAWEFIPQNAGSPVKAAATTLVRKGAGIGNFIWVDSQDMAGVDNTILRGCAVWLIGVQREANEIARNLKNIPANLARPKASDVAMLRRGEFFACFHDRVVKTYVQPVWMEAGEAIVVAQGGTATTSAPPSPRRSTPLPPVKEDPAMCQEHQRLAQENIDLKDTITELRSAARRQSDELANLGAELRRHTEAGEAARLIVRGLQMLGVAGGSGGAPVDVETIVAQVLARVPAGGAVIQVTPPEKLRAEFQRDEVARILAKVRELPPLPQQILKLLVSIEGRSIFQKVIAERLGRTYGGGSQKKTFTEAVELLGDFVQSDSHGVRAAVREKIADDLATYQPTDAEVETTYQHVLTILAGAVAE